MFDTKMRYYQKLTGTNVWNLCTKEEYDHLKNLPTHNVLVGGANPNKPVTVLLTDEKLLELVSCDEYTIFEAIMQLQSWIDFVIANRSEEAFKVLKEELKSKELNGIKLSEIESVKVYRNELKVIRK